MKRRRAETILAVLIVLSLVFSGGCVKRNLQIKSDPPGATVYFNEKKISETPLDYDFMWYAEHKVKLVKEGYEPIERIETIKSPPQFWIPFDFILDLLPNTFWDRRELSYTLTPRQE